jgi:hypothetical protein
MAQVGASATDDRLGGLRPQLTARPPLPTPPDLPELPDHGVLVAELKKLREKGLGALRTLGLEALPEATYLAGEADTAVYAREPAAQEALLRKAVLRLGDGPIGEAAAKSFGLTPETRGRPSAIRRSVASDLFSQDPDSFRVSTERTLISELADAMLGLIHDQRMRQAHVAMQRRHPADTRLAVQWAERFEAYNRIYSPVTGLAGDLAAARDTLLYDRARPPWVPEGEEWDYVAQAQGYVRFALYHYASFLLQVKRFMVSHGGLWLLADQQQEYELANAVYEIQWNNCLNERDDSWLRSVLTDTKHEELHHFLTVLADEPIGRATHEEYQEWFARCDCVPLPAVAGWELSETAESLYDADERNVIAEILRGSDGLVRDDCQVHATIQACADYVSRIDRSWEDIVDWWRES